MNPAMETQLRPMSLAEIVDYSFRLYRKNVIAFAGIVAVMQIVSSFLRFSIEVASFLEIPRLFPDVHRDFFSISILRFIGVLVQRSISIIGFAFSQAVVSAATSAIYVGGDTSFSRAFLAFRGRVGSLLRLCFGISSFYFIGIICLFFPFVYMNIVWGFAIPAGVIEDLPLFASLRRSSQLTERAKRRIFIIYIVTVAFSYAVSFGLQLLLIGIQRIVGAARFSPLGVLVVGDLMTFIVSTLMIPLAMIVLTIAYYDQRVRREGFDIDLKTSPVTLSALVE